MQISRYIRLAKETYPRYVRFLLFRRFLNFVTIKDEDECWEWQGQIDKDGYGKVAHFDWRGKHIQFAHIAAYVLFVGEIPKRKGKKKLCVCHSCDNPPCCNPNHLWLGTHKQNQEDCTNKGRGREGERHGRAKLSEEDVLAIRTLYDKGEYDQYQLADKFHVTQATISGIICGKIWTKI